MTGLVGTSSSGNQLAMQNLATFLSGSVGSIVQSYWINSPNNLSTWNNPLTEKERIRDFHQKELAFFFKDDWKVHQNLTLNLGLRWEYYGVPFLKNGMTVALNGGPNAMYGISGRTWDQAFWKPSEAQAALTQLIFVGPNSPNSGQSIYPKDKNNFGPAIGFAWTLPWFGKGKTTLRGGYQITYEGSLNANTMETIIGNPPGSFYTDTYTPTSYTDLTNISQYVPVPQAVKPMQPFPLTDRTQAISVFDPNFATPYIQNITMSLTRNIGSNLIADVRYIGTISHKGFTTMDIDIPNFRTNGLLQAFNAARYGDDSNPATALLDRIFQPVRGTKSGASYLRSSTQTATALGYVYGARYYLANGDYNSLANIISYWPVANVAGGLLRAADALYPGQFPENFIKTNPQFNSVTVYNNLGSSNYNSMQAQITMRPTHGLSFQGSYTWSKSLGYSGSWTDILNRSADYTVQGADRRHVFTTYGTFDLPFGPNRLLLSKTSGALERLVQGWQLSWIGNASSGSPLSISAALRVVAARRETCERIASELRAEAAENQLVERGTAIRHGVLGLYAAACSAGRAIRCRASQGVFASSELAAIWQLPSSRLPDRSIRAGRDCRWRPRRPLCCARRRCRHPARRARAGLDPRAAAPAERRRPRHRRAGEVELSRRQRRRGPAPRALRGDRARSQGGRRRGRASASSPRSATCTLLDLSQPDMRLQPAGG